jgi:Mn2+/Fe2+ NRAMP family transporter
VLLVAILLLVNKREIMGDFANNRWLNLAAIAVTIVTSTLSLSLLGLTVYNLIF